MIEYYYQWLRMKGVDGHMKRFTIDALRNYMTVGARGGSHPYDYQRPRPYPAEGVWL